MIISDLIKHQLAPKGALRAGINLSNFLLVSSKSAGGSPEGISPDIAKRVAVRLDVPCEFIIFDRPGKLADAVTDDIWDIGNIAFEVERAQTVNFSNPYVLIEANFLVWKADDFRVNDDVNYESVRIAVSERSAYDLWLTKNFNSAKIIRVPSIQAAHDLFFEKKVGVLASLKPKILDDIKNNNDIRLIEPPFTAVKQSIGVPKGKPEAIKFINELISSSIKSGWIAARLETHGMTN